MAADVVVFVLLVCCFCTSLYGKVVVFVVCNIIKSRWAVGQAATSD